MQDQTLDDKLTITENSESFTNCRVSPCFNYIAANTNIKATLYLF